jgi:hypothetical protein
MKQGVISVRFFSSSKYIEYLQLSMKNLFAWLLLLNSAFAFADWVKINGVTDKLSEIFIDEKTIRQTGPMNTMRRVWEVNNMAKGAPDRVLSVKSHMEYDCKDRRFRILEESKFSEHWAQGKILSATAKDAQPGNWRVITKGATSETVFNRVCPNSDTDSSKN